VRTSGLPTPRPGRHSPLRDGIRRAGWGDQGKPCAGQEVGQAELRVVGTSGARDCRVRLARPKNFPAAFSKRNRGGDVADEDIDPAGGQVDSAGPSPSGTCTQLDAGHRGQHRRDR